MRANERLNEIVKILNKQGRVHVKDLSKMFEVTEDLIRKDLKKLEEKQLIDRIYGGAERKSKKFDAANVKYRMNLNKEAKASIASKALRTIKNGETLFLDTSSTCATLAEALGKSNMELTVITNMLEIVKLLEPNNDIRVILIGGLYNRQIGGFVGYEVINRIESYMVDRAFISCMAVDIEGDRLLSSTKDIGFTKSAMLRHARYKVLLSETRKFNDSGTVKFYSVSDMDEIICDKQPKQKDKNTIDALKLIIR